MPKLIENKEQIRRAFQRLDELVGHPVNLLIGGGAAILLLDIMPIATMDIDAMPFKSILGMEDLKPFCERVASEQGLASDWLNAYFYQFTHCLPSDYGKRLKVFLKGKHLTCHLLSASDIAIMKLFAGRVKDESHLRYLFKSGSGDMRLIDEHLDLLVGQNHPGSQKALVKFESITEEFGLA